MILVLAKKKKAKLILKNMPNYRLHLFLLIWSCVFVFSAAIDTIRANESLKDSDALISNGNKFKLSFFSPPSSTHRYVGIMFNLPGMTVVWVANRDNPLNDSSGTFEMSSDGNLVILDSRKAIVWSTNLSASVASSSSRAVLLDTGNLVLQDDDSIGDGYVWESFLHASDTQVEKMKVFTDLNRNERNMLTSWRSPDDPAPGRFTLTIEPLDIPQSFVWMDGDPYWRSGPWNGQIFSGIPGMRSDYGYGANVVTESPGIAYQVFSLSNSSHLLFTFLNSSGSIEEKIWSDENKRWEVTWSSMSNKCYRYGKCGPFGSCNSDERPICTCLRGFVPKSKDEWDAGSWSSGCTRRTPLQCEHNSTTGKQDEFLKMERVKLPDHYSYKWYSAEACRDTCLSSCSCIAYADASGIGCLHWTSNLTDTQKFTYGGDDLYIRLAYSELAEEKRNTRIIIVTTVVLGSILAVVCAYFLLKLLLSYRAGSGLIFFETKGGDAKYSEESKLKHDKHGVKFEELHVFQLQMLSNATGNFDSVNKLGQGGFGLVYKGILPNGVEIAVKRLARSSNQGVEEFMNEVEVISGLQHRNLVKLVGCCVESEEKILVYECVPNGSLDAYLFGSHKHELLLDWETRKSIIEGICRGLLYLHRDSRLKVIHRDLKASNILLDEVLNAKISDFGMARICSGNDDQASTTRVVGTFGYMSPEYALRGIFSEKSDVYSFGVLLLEIVSGKKNSSFHDDDGQTFLTAYAWELWIEGKMVELVDPTMYDAGVMEDDVVRYANVGLLCVQEMAADRPNTCTVLSMLRREIVELPRPKQPGFLGMQSFQGAQTSAESRSKSSLNDVTNSIVEGR